MPIIHKSMTSRHQGIIACAWDLKHYPRNACCLWQNLMQTCNDGVYQWVHLVLRWPRRAIPFRILLKLHFVNLHIFNLAFLQTSTFLTLYVFKLAFCQLCIFTNRYILANQIFPILISLIRELSRAYTSRLHTLNCDSVAPLSCGSVFNPYTAN